MYMTMLLQSSFSVTEKSLTSSYLTLCEKHKKLLDWYTDCCNNLPFCHQSMLIPYLGVILQALYEKECHMALQDKVQEATNEAKNALEAYVYGLRNKLYDQLSDYVTDDFKESTSRKLEQMEVSMQSAMHCTHSPPL